MEGKGICMRCLNVKTRNKEMAKSLVKVSIADTIVISNHQTHVMCVSFTFIVEP